jgi:hypothetical protein
MWGLMITSNYFAGRGSSHYLAPGRRGGPGPHQAGLSGPLRRQETPKPGRLSGKSEFLVW